MQRWNTSIIIIVASTILAEVILLISEGEINMDTGGWIAVSVALIGVAGGVWGQIIQFKKDGQRIETVNQTSASVKKDTSKMKPLVKQIYNKIDVIVEQMLTKVLPHITSTEAAFKEFHSNIAFLVKETEYRERLRKDISPTVANPEYLKSGIDIVFEQNVKLQQEVIQLQRQIHELNLEIQNLRGMSKSKSQMSDEIYEDELPCWESDRDYEYER